MSIVQRFQLQTQIRLLFIESHRTQQNALPLPRYAFEYSVPVRVNP